MAEVTATGEHEHDESEQAVAELEKAVSSSCPTETTGVSSDTQAAAFRGNTVKLLGKPPDHSFIMQIVKTESARAVEDGRRLVVQQGAEAMELGQGEEDEVDGVVPAASSVGYSVHEGDHTEPGVSFRDRSDVTHIAPTTATAMEPLACTSGDVSIVHNVMPSKPNVRVTVGEGHFSAQSTLQHFAEVVEAATNLSALPTVKSPEVPVKSVGMVKTLAAAAATPGKLPLVRQVTPVNLKASEQQALLAKIQSGQTQGSAGPSAITVPQVSLAPPQHVALPPQVIAMAAQNQPKLTESLVAQLAKQTGNKVLQDAAASSKTQASLLGSASTPGMQVVFTPRLPGTTISRGVSGQMVSPVVSPSAQAGTHVEPRLVPRCLVCNDKSSGVHYGVLACEGCKGFFRRALQDKGDASRKKCYYTQNCDITVQTRNRCQFCRLKKCQALGMAKSAAKLGRRSRKMREMISDMSRSIEDSQTSQALQGLLGLGGAGNIPLLNAVGTPAAAVAPPAAAAALGSAGEVSHTVEVSTEPVGTTPLMQRSATVTASAPPAMVVTSPQLQQQGVYKPGSAPMSDLIRLMHNRAQQDQAAAVSQQQQQQQQAESHVFSGSPISVSVTAAKKPAVTHTVANPASSTLKTQFPQGNQAVVASASSTLTQQALAQLMQAQPQSSQIILSPNTTQIPVGKPPTVANILRSAKGQTGAPVQILVTPQTGSRPTQPQQPQSPMIVSNINLSGAGGVAQGLVVSPQTVLTSSPPAYTPATVSTTRSEEHNKSPFKKRPYLGTLGSPSTMDWNQVSPSEKQVKLEPKLEPGSSGSAILSPTVTTPALLPAQQQQQQQHQQLSADNATVLLVQTPDGKQQTIVVNPEALISAAQKQNNVKDMALRRGSEIGDAAKQPSNIAKTISEGFDSIFRYTKNQVEQLKLGHSSSLVTNGGGNNLDERQTSLCWQRFKTRFNNVVRDVINFAKKVPGFLGLANDDQISLIRGGSFEVACVVHASFIEPEQNVMYLASDSGYSVSREQLRESFPPMADFMDLLFSFAAKFNAFLLTQGEVALFSALMLITPDRSGLKSRETVSKLQELLIESLQNQISTNHPNEAGLFPRLLMVISNLRELSVEQRRVQAVMKNEPGAGDSGEAFEPFGLFDRSEV